MDNRTKYDIVVVEDTAFDNGYNQLFRALNPNSILVYNVEDMVNKVLEKIGNDGCIYKLTINGHGSPGSISLGDGQGQTSGRYLSNYNVEKWADQIERLEGRFCEEAEGIFLRGSNVGAKKLGLLLLENLSARTSAIVSAPTGYTTPFSVYGKLQQVKYGSDQNNVMGISRRSTYKAQIDVDASRKPVEQNGDIISQQQQVGQDFDPTNVGQDAGDSTEKLASKTANAVLNKAVPNGDDFLERKVPTGMTFTSNAQHQVIDFSQVVNIGWLDKLPPDGDPAGVQPIYLDQNTAQDFINGIDITHEPDCVDHHGYEINGYIFFFCDTTGDGVGAPTIPPSLLIEDCWMLVPAGDWSRAYTLNREARRILKRLD